ncbi:MAG: hypothetical protein L0211_05770 [Planctomycetaceae bacterium]|nr:hypothetical protein [Planctomycetaceae bacterium]
MFRAHQLSIGFFVLGLLLARTAAAQFDQLAAKIPSTANAIVLLDAQRIMASPFAVKEGLKEKYEEAFASGLATIPPDTRQMVLSTQLDFEHMKPLWQMAVADFGDPRTVVNIARRTKGNIDKIGELDAVVLSDNSMCVQLSPTRLGVMAPANRQTVARWVHDIESRDHVALSSYLKGTLTASQTSQVVIAFDLEDAVPPEIIKQKLAACETLAGKNVDLERAAFALSGLRGLVLEVAFTEGTFGRVMVHFSRDASILAPFAKPMLLEVLGNMGAMIDDIADWEVKTEPQRFTFSGPLSQSGRRRVLSLIDHPTEALIAAGRENASAPPPESSQAAYATQQYFKSITKIRDDLREKAKDAKTFGQHAMWLDNWARRIDRLPIMDVDPEMLAYGNYVTGAMRDTSAALKGIGIRSGARSAQVPTTYSTGVQTNYSYGWGGWSSYSYYNNGHERRAIRAEEKAAGANSALGIQAEVENETAKIRQKMTQKYKINF